MKPTQLSKHNWTLIGCSGRFLIANEKIKATDFIRNMCEEPMLSESGGWDTTFKPSDWRGPAWHLARNELPYWVGKTYAEYQKEADISLHQYEIFRCSK